MGYLLPGTVVSVLGSHVKVRLDDNREVRTSLFSLSNPGSLAYQLTHSFYFWKQFWARKWFVNCNSLSIEEEVVSRVWEPIRLRHLL
jgi:hypothetical protein